MKDTVLVLLVGFAATLSLTGPSAAHPTLAAPPESVQLAAQINGQPAANASAGHPVRLDPARPARFTVIVTNSTSSPVSIRRLDFSGHVVGLTFYSYGSAVDLAVPAGARQAVSYTLDMSGLDGQATGLIGSTLTAVDTQGHTVSALPTVVDIRGSLISVYGLFGLALLILTVLAIADSALAIARHRLWTNRWRRGMRLLTPGIGIGLVLVFTGSVVRWWVPTSAHWLVAAAAFAVVFFFIGYLSPTPDRGDDETEDECEYDEFESDGPTETMRDASATTLSSHEGA